MKLQVLLTSLSVQLVLEMVNALNERPVIGIVFEETKDDPHGDSSLYTSYVEYIQSAGALAVPIRVKEKDQYYEDIFTKINGVLFPGGGVSLITSEFANAGRKLFALSKKAKKKGDHFPLWGTCLGFELLAQMAVGNTSLLTDCSAEDVMMPLHLLPDGESSRLLHGIAKDDLYMLTHYNVTANYHQECLTPKTFNAHGKLKSFYKPISVNYDKNGLEFISMFEAHEYPIYGSQWHPEKNAFQWSLDHHLNHSYGAVKVAQYFANFFVNEARKNNHRFPDNASLAKELFYNYKPVFFGLPKMDAKYYLNFTADDDAEFEMTWNNLKDEFGILALWKKSKLEASYMICSIVAFFVIGVSFVFIMDFVIAISGRIFNVPLNLPNNNSERDCDVEIKVMEAYNSEMDGDKIPLLDDLDIFNAKRKL